MIVSIKGRVVNYEGPGWYVRGEKQVEWYDMMEDEQRDAAAEYINLEGDWRGEPTHTVDIPASGNLDLSSGFMFFGICLLCYILGVLTVLSLII